MSAFGIPPPEVVICLHAGRLCSCSRCSFWDCLDVGIEELTPRSTSSPRCKIFAWGLEAAVLGFLAWNLFELVSLTSINKTMCNTAACKRSIRCPFATDLSRAFSGTLISHDVFVVLDVMWLAGVLKPILDHRGVTKNEMGQKVRGMCFFLFAESTVACVAADGARSATRRKTRTGLVCWYHVATLCVRRS